MSRSTARHEPVGCQRHGRVGYQPPPLAVPLVAPLLRLPPLLVPLPPLPFRLAPLVLLPAIPLDPTLESFPPLDAG